MERIPFLSRRKEALTKKKEEEKFQELLQQTLHKLLNHLRSGGILQEISEYKDYEENYWVALESRKGRKMSVSFYLTYDKNGDSKDFHFWAGESGFLSGARRDLLFTASRFDPSLPFLSGEGGYLLNLDEVYEDRARVSRQLTKEQQTKFLEELLSSDVDRDRTQNEYERAKSGETSGWRVFWAREKGIGPLALISND